MSLIFNLTASHVHHAQTSSQAQEILKESQPAAKDPEEYDKFDGIMNTLHRLFQFKTRTDRQKALSTELKGLDMGVQQKVKTEYLIRESISVKEKAAKMSVSDFDMLKVLGKSYL